MEEGEEEEILEGMGEGEEEEEWGGESEERRRRKKEEEYEEGGRRKRTGNKPKKETEIHDCLKKNRDPSARPSVRLNVPPY